MTTVALEAKKFWMTSVSSVIDFALLITTRNWAHTSRPFVCHEPNAQSLLMTQRSRPRASGGGPSTWPGGVLPEPVASLTRSSINKSM